MKKQDLKSFDIATYDVEIDFSKKIAPIQKRIGKLDQSHEIKSLKAHKDFLGKEKSSKDKLVELDEKQILREQRIEKAVENKLVKLRRKDQNIKNDFVEHKKVQNAANSTDASSVKARITELESDESADKKVITDKYKKNVESYVEKLDTYISNFENNKLTFNDQYDKYSQILNDSLEKIDRLKQESDEVIEKLLNEYLEKKHTEDETSYQSQTEVGKEINRDVIDIRKQSNIKTAKANNYVDTLRYQYDKRYKSHINNLKETIINLQNDFIVRQSLINKDLNINLEKVEVELQNLQPKTPKKILKSIQNKKDLFTMRASTIITYEEQIHNEKIDQLQSQVDKYENNLKNELLNLEKLAVFLVNDQDQLKNTGEYFKTLNLDLKSELVKSEISNNSYLVSHEKLKTEYTNNYTKLFNDIKRRLIDANKSQIDQLTTINAELDEINKFLDTVEPLKEIELNKLRESIEVSEIQERYQIKYAKENHEIKLLNNNTKKEIALEEIRIKGSLSENNKDITEIKNKEIMDKSIEKAKLKQSKANEIYKLRLNSTKLERNILKSSYETELEKADINKELVKILTEKKNILLEKEIESQMENIELESNYKKEVVNKSLEEELLKLQENVSKISYESDSFVSGVNILVTKEEQIIDKEIVAINSKMDQKLSLIDEALNREIKEPSLNMARSEVIVKERLMKFTLNDETLQEYIIASTTLQSDDALTVEQLKLAIVKNKSVYEKVNKYIETTYDCLIDAVAFMNELEERSLLNRISSTGDQNTTKRLKKQLTKFESEKKRQHATIISARNDHKNRQTTIIKGNLQRLNKLKNLEFDGLSEQVETIFKNISNQLTSLQVNIKKEVENLYAPLTRTDQELLDNANKNSIKARDLVERDREALIAPINTRLRDFITEKEAEKHRIVDEYNLQIKEITSSINSIEDVAKVKIDEIQEDEDKLLSVQKDQLHLVKDNEDTEITKEIQSISANKLELEQSYIKKLEQLDDKDDEAKKIYEYEERIYNIALETAESRFNDAFVKTNKAHELHLHDGEENKQIITNNAEKNIERINKELLNATNEFEKNIFTVRPKFEESIGDSQRAIDAEQVVKEARKIELLEMNQLRTEAIENGLYTSFKEAYEKLNENLNYYLEKYKIIEDEYRQSLSDANDVISKNFDIFQNALFELGETKITKTQKELSILNDKLT